MTYLEFVLFYLLYVSSSATLRSCASHYPAGGAVGVWMLTVQVARGV